MMENLPTVDQALPNNAKVVNFRFKLNILLMDMFIVVDLLNIGINKKFCFY